MIKVPVKEPDGTPVLDEDGEPVMLERYERPRWEAAAWTLERRFPETWGRKTELAVTHTERPTAREELENDPGAVITLYQQAKALLQAVEDLQAERARKRAERDAKARPACARRQGTELVAAVALPKMNIRRSPSAVEMTNNFNAQSMHTLPTRHHLGNATR